MPDMPGKQVMGAEELTLSAGFTRVLLIHHFAVIDSQLLISD
jgi:hypothetical protein